MKTVNTGMVAIGKLPICVNTLRDLLDEVKASPDVLLGREVIEGLHSLVTEATTYVADQRKVLAEIESRPAEAVTKALRADDACHRSLDKAGQLTIRTDNNRGKDVTFKLFVGHDADTLARRLDIIKINGVSFVVDAVEVRVDNPLLAVNQELQGRLDDGFKLTRDGGDTDPTFIAINGLPHFLTLYPLGVDHEDS